MARPALPTVGASTDTWGTELNSVLTDLQGSLDAKAMVPVATGLYVSPLNVLPGVGDDYSPIAADTLVAVPLYVGPSGLTVDRISINVQVSDSGSARLGVYTNSGYAPASLIDDHGTVSVATTGEKSITISETYTASAYPYLVWLTLVSDVAPTLGGWNPSTTGFGHTNTDPYNVVIASGYEMSHTYGALPSTYSGTLVSGNDTAGEGALPLIFLRIA